jgi:hypothetical protein
MAQSPPLKGIRVLEFAGLAPGMRIPLVDDIAPPRILTAE